MAFKSWFSTRRKRELTLTIVVRNSSTGLLNISENQTGMKKKKNNTGELNKLNKWKIKPSKDNKREKN